MGAATFASWGQATSTAMRCHHSLGRSARLVPFKLQVRHSIHGSDSHRGSQQPGQVCGHHSQCHIHQTGNIAWASLLKWWLSYVYYLFSQCKSASGKPRPGIFLSTLSLLRSIQWRGCACCQQRPWAPSPHCSLCSRCSWATARWVQGCWCVLPMCPCNLN